jgi:Flp pilus assembly protein TadD
MHRRAIGGDPHRDFLHNNLGYNLWMQGRRMEAAGCFRKALELNPGSENARNNLGMALADRPEEALSHFRQAADLGVAHNNLAALRFETGDLDGARRELELALQYRQDMPQILENLKRVAAMDGKPVVIPPAKSVSVWRSFARGMKQAFLTGEQKKDGQTAAESAR